MHRQITLLVFWKWAYSGIVSNAEVFWQIYCSRRLRDLPCIRNEWDPFDLKCNQDRNEFSRLCAGLALTAGSIV